MDARFLMGLRSMRVLLTFVGVLLLLFSLETAPLAGENPPSPAARGAFEAVRAAEAAGADVGPLVAQYNFLLQAQGNDSSFLLLQNEAFDAERAASNTQNLRDIISIILVPLIALVLSLALHATRDLFAMLERKKLLDSRIDRSGNGA